LRQRGCSPDERLTQRIWERGEARLCPRQPTQNASGKEKKTCLQCREMDFEYKIDLTVERREKKKTTTTTELNPTFALNSCTSRKCTMKQPRLVLGTHKYRSTPVPSRQEVHTSVVRPPLHTQQSRCARRSASPFRRLSVEIRWKPTPKRPSAAPSEPATP